MTFNPLFGESFKAPGWRNISDRTSKPQTFEKMWKTILPRQAPSLHKILSPCATSIIKFIVSVDP